MQLFLLLNLGGSSVYSKAAILDLQRKPDRVLYLCTYFNYIIRALFVILCIGFNFISAPFLHGFKSVCKDLKKNGNVYQ